MKREQNSKLILIASLILTGAFAFINLYEYVIVGILKRTGGYPFGGEGPTPWYYQSADLYAAANLSWGIVFLLLMIISLVVFKRRKYYAQLILLTTTIALVTLQIFTS